MANSSDRSIGTPAVAVFRRVIAINILLFAFAVLALAFGPFTVSRHVLLTEFAVLAAGFVVVMAINAFLVHLSLRPLDRLAELMRRVDPLADMSHAPVTGHADLRRVIDAFNAMVDRLADERTNAVTFALQAQEAERRRLARELHDEVGQTLTVALLNLRHVAATASPMVVEELHQAQETIRTSLNEVRGIAHRLRPGVLDDLGLRAALESLTDEFQRPGSCEVVTAIDELLPELSDEQELVCYRIAQEALTNAVRHGHANSIELGLRAQGATVLLSIEDNGSGADVGSTAGAGIRGMKERALLIGGQLSVQPAAKGTGTRIDLSFFAQVVSGA